MKVPVLQNDPNIRYSPIALDGLKILGDPELINLKAVNRIVRVNNKSGVVQMYVVLHDGKGEEFKLEIPFYVYCCLSQVDIVTCRLYKLSDGLRVYNCIEVESLDKPSLTTVDTVTQPLADNNSCLPERYFDLYKVDGPIDRFINNYRANLVAAYINTPRIDGTVHRAPVPILDLLSGKPLMVSYRELEISGKTYKVDMRGKL